MESYDSSGDAALVMEVVQRRRVRQGWEDPKIGDQTARNRHAMVSMIAKLWQNYTCFV